VIATTLTDTLYGTPSHLLLFSLAGLYTKTARASGCPGTTGALPGSSGVVHLLTRYYVPSRHTTFLYSARLMLPLGINSVGWIMDALSDPARAFSTGS